MRVIQLGLAFLMLCFFAPYAFGADSEGIGWIPTWNQALFEAKQTNRPILLMAGAPACGGVPGVW